MWCELLKLEQVGIHDNFFELGGHSLLATQVISRIRETFATEMSLRTLFESPTVAKLSEILEQDTAKTTVVSIHPVERGTNLPLSFAQNVFGYCTN